MIFLICPDPEWTDAEPDLAARPAKMVIQRFFDCTDEGRDIGCTPLIP